MPLELKERLTEWATALNLVYGFFKDKAVSYLLESGSVKDIRRAKEVTNEAKCNNEHDIQLLLPYNVNPELFKAQRIIPVLQYEHK